MNQIYFCGYDGVHTSDFTYDIPKGFPCYLLVLTVTPARFLLRGQIRTCPAHTAILYPPNCPIWYAAANQAYANHWLRFSTDDPLVTEFPLQAVPFQVSDPMYCRNLFQLLTWEFCSGQTFLTFQPDAARNLRSAPVIDQLLSILFSKLRDDLVNGADTLPVRANSHYDYELLDLRRQISSNPQFPWKIADMAAQLHISCGYLQLLYKQKFGVSCMEDVIAFRLARARELLIYTAKSVAEIAEECGYANP
ncbi:MAG: AraC family transcriptional regulator [Eubacteriales bacterium]|nr:AraC family transcriptional regulator [Eubacteriales bacterium]